VRQYRGLSQVELSGKIGKSQAYLAQIENGKREGTVAVYRAIAQALDVDLEILSIGETDTAQGNSAFTDNACNSSLAISAFTVSSTIRCR